MTNEEKQIIINLSKKFADGFKDTIGPISGSGWLIVDPLSGYLNHLGYVNKLQQLPANEEHPLILVLQFPDGSIFIPAASDLPIKGIRDWVWI